MILLIENDEVFRQRVIGCLRWLGDDVQEYASPSELPSLALLRRPAVVVTRYELPEEDGLAFADRFHEVHPSVPIFLLTGTWSPYLAKEAAMRTFVWVRQVPVGLGELCSLIFSVCGRRSGGLALSA